MISPTQSNVLDYNKYSQSVDTQITKAISHNDQLIREDSASSQIHLIASMSNTNDVNS